MESTPQFLLISVGERPGFHSAVRHALADLVTDSDRVVSGASSDERTTGTEAQPAYQDLLGKARRFLSQALPRADVRLVTADTLPQATRSLTGRPTGPDAAPPLILVDAAGAGLGTAALDSSTEQRLAGVLVERLGLEPEELTPDARFREDLGLDSLDMVELVSALENELSVPVSDEMALSLTSLGEVVAYVDAQHAAATAAAERAA
jgi:acyl carrier protein